MVGATGEECALTVLTSFQETDQNLALSELSEPIGLVPSTVLRLLAPLIHFGFVQRRADGRYSPGPAVAKLNHVYALSFNMQEIVLPAFPCPCSAHAANRRLRSFFVGYFSWAISSTRKVDAMKATQHRLRSPVYLNNQPLQFLG
ncbi:MAG: helix-turn-helix domain-containing protein [Burkholderiaceae bacterium]